MENRTNKGKQKIEMKLIESEKARVVTFSKRKKTLFSSAEKLSTRTGADVGVMLFSPSGKPCSYGSTSIENISDKFLEVKQEDRRRDHAEGKSNVFETFEDIRKELQALDEKEKKRILMYKIMHPGSEVPPPDKHRSEQLLAIKLRAGKAKRETRSAILAEHLKIDLNVVAEPEEEESS